MIRTRLQRLKEKDTRRLFVAILGGKMLGVLTLLGIMKGALWYFDSAVGALPVAPSHSANELINPINTMWVLVTAFLVFFMQAGFMALEAGFARSRETVNILLECVFDTCLCGVLFWAIGFAFMFGSGNGVIGHQYFFLHGIGGGYGTTGVAFMAFFLFQFAFADTASTITSGAMVGRTGFKGDILYSICVSGFIYPIFGHWVWGPGGWLGNTMGWFHSMAGDAVFRDFAGSTVVHTVGGTVALIGAIALGPRLGRKFKRDGGGPTPPHDLTMASIGAVILWFGWYGFNPGSTLSAMDWTGIGRVAGNTTLAACAGGMIAVLFVYPRSYKWDLGMSLNGFLGGLVAITAPCYWVSPTGALIIGGLAGVIVPLAVDLLEHLRIDDPIGAVPVHMVCGIWGTLSVGLFATGQFGLPTADGADTSLAVRGLFYHGGTEQLRAQAIGSLSCLVAVGGAALVIMYAIKAIRGSWSLRVSRDGELEGLDLHEHGTPAYHVEFGQGMTYSAPLGMSGGFVEKVPPAKTPEHA
ncbi:MAG: ammonium transporter, Amt family [Acidimicrobiaceae bacterium]|jgi:Amt family ammonium transporter|nr:ammonium transporter, Amt family [Acidimicrobiaceae bacterium]MDQ1445286.1 ammonium transporter, Amt family [Acidimicrobiaceae bacterium]